MIKYADDHCSARRSLEAADESHHECLGLAEGKQMTARKWFGLQA